MPHQIPQNNMVLIIVLFLYAVEHSFSINNAYYSLRIREFSSKVIDSLSVLLAFKLLRKLFVPFWILKEVTYILALRKQLIKSTGMCLVTISLKTISNRCLKLLEEFLKISIHSLLTNWIFNLYQSDSLLSKTCHLLHKCKSTLLISLKSH